MIRPVLLLAAPLILSGCIAYHIHGEDGPRAVRAALGETVQVGDHSVTPLAVIEDSRCPAGTQCVWAGRVRLSARIDGANTELTLGQPGPVQLVWVAPAKHADEQIFASQYRFGLRGR